MFFQTGAQLQAAINALPTSNIGKFVPFDAFYYQATYMGGYTGALSPLDHFVMIGARQNFKPSEVFDPIFYKAQYADLAASNFDSADLLIHFLKFGLSEGRAPNAILASFDGAAYLANYPDVAAYVNAHLADFNGSATNGAIAHYVKFGFAEGRVPALPNTVSNYHTLQEVVVPGQEANPGQTVIYWGYNPIAPGNTGSGAPSTGGIPVADLVSFLTTITGLDLTELGLIDADGVNPFQNVTSITLSNPLNNSGSASASGDGDVDQSPQLFITLADGSVFNAEVALGNAYFTFLNNLLFDENGNTRLFEKVVGSTSGTSDTLVPIRLTPTQDNGGTLEGGVTNSANDTFVAGRLELLHQAYLDGGAGFNVLEVDTKGTYAQPAALLNIQEVRVNDLPNFYTTPYGSGDGYLENTNVNDSGFLSPEGGIGEDSSSSYDNNSWLDLSRATAIQRLVVTDQSESSGDLTIVGVRNGATLRLEGAFNGGATTVQYGQGQTGTMRLELVLGDVNEPINILQNSSVIDINSLGVENAMDRFFAGGDISRMIVRGPAVFAVEGDLNDSFNAGRPAIIDASANTGGLDVTLNEHYDVRVVGTAADDEITVTDGGKATITAGNGNNTIDVYDNDVVVVTSGTGNDAIDATDTSVSVTITAGDGSNSVDVSGSNVATVTTGTGADTITAENVTKLTVTAGDGANNIDADGSTTVTITTGTGNDTISAIDTGTVVIDAGAGNNTVKVMAADISITTGTGNDNITLAGTDTTFDLGDDEGVGTGAGGFNDGNDLNAVNSHFSDDVAPGALINLNLGNGTNTVTLGLDIEDDGTTEVGLTALEGSVITGTGIRLVVENNSDLTQANITGATITNVTLRQELRITAEQFTDIGAAAFVAARDEEGATEDLYIVMTEDAVLADLVDLSQLSLSVRLHVELRNGAELTLTAEQLHRHFAEEGITADDGLNGSVVITNAGNAFNAFVSGDLATPVGIVAGGSLSDSFATSDDITVNRSFTGFNRPTEQASVDVTLIDSDVTPVVSGNLSVDGGNPTVLKIVGDQNITFTGTVNLGENGNGIDFSELNGTVTGLTIKNFQNIDTITGNNSGARINVELQGDVGSSATDGLVTSGVETYVVTALTGERTIWFNDGSQDLETVGLKGNAGDTLVLNNVPYGHVEPSILLEGDGYANYNSPGSLQVDGSPNTSDIGSVEVNYAPASDAIANIDINNGGVELGLTNTGGERKLVVDSITVTNAIVANINVADGDVTIKNFTANGVTSLTVAGTEDVSLSLDDATDDLTSVNATGVAGTFSLVLQPGSSYDLSDASLSGIDQVVFGAGSSLTITVAQSAAIGAANFIANAPATLNLEGLDSAPFSLAAFDSDLNVAVLGVAALPVVTLDPATDLTGIDALNVPAGTVLNMTATQFQQLSGMGGPGGDRIIGFGTLNITAVTQADLDLVGGLDLSAVAGTITLGTVSIGTNVEFGANDNLGDFTSIVLADGVELTLDEIQKADGKDIGGGANTTLTFSDTAAGAFESIDAGGFTVGTLKLLNVLVDNRNIELMFANLPSATVIEIYNDLGFVGAINRVVIVDEGTTVPGFVVFNPNTGDTEIRTFDLTLNGGVEISGNLRLSTTDKDTDLIPTHLQTLTINSNGTAPNLLTGVAANVITGDITPLAIIGGTEDNNLKQVIINAAQDFIVEGEVVFSSLNGNDAVTANDDDAAVVTLTVNGTANVSLGINTDDNDVDGLVVTNAGTGNLSVRIDENSIDSADALSFLGSNVQLTISGNVDLSNDTLTAVDQITIADGGTLTLSQAQLDAVGPANLVDGGNVGSAVLNINGLGGGVFDATLLAAGIDLQTVTVAPGVVTLNAATNLTGVNTLVVPEGGTLNLTAAQYQQLVGNGTVTGLDSGNGGTAAFTLNITGLTQADVDAGFDLADISNDATITITLAGNVNFDANTQLRENANANALHDLTINLSAGQVLGLATSVQADGLDVVGGAGSTITFRFSALTGGDVVPDSDGLFGTIDASGYDVDFLRALDQFVGGINVEDILDDLDSSVTLVVVDTPEELGLIDQTFRTVIVEPGVTVPAVITFSDLSVGEEVRTLSLELQGGTRIVGGIQLFTSEENGMPAAPEAIRYFQTLNINSNGTAVNIADGVTTANVISGNITAADGDGGGPLEENNLLNVNITATQNLVITGAGSTGNIVFSSVNGSTFPTATLNIDGTANVTVDQLDVSDAQVSNLVINNNGTGTLTVTGSSPAIFDNAGLDTANLETLTLSGTGNIVLGDSDPTTPETAIEAANLSVINASGLSGNLTIGTVTDIDSDSFSFTSGTGVTKLTLTDAVLSDDQPTESGWSFNFANAAAGSEFHLASGLNTIDTGALNINLGANTTLFIDASTDLTALALTINQTQPIVLGDEVVLTLTAAQANGLNIISGPDTDGDGILGRVNIIRLGDTPVDFSGIAANIAGTVSLADDDVSLDVATDLGDFTVVLNDVGGDNNTLAGQTIRFTTVAQAERAIDVIDTLPNGTSSTNVVWLFTSITAPVDTSAYDNALGRLWLNQALINGEGGDVEQLFTTLPNTILRVDFSTLNELNVLLAADPVNRTVEFVHFTQLNDLTFSDTGATPEEFIQNLTLNLGGEVTIGDIVLDDVVSAGNIDPNSIAFNALTINSFRAVRTDDLLAAEDFVNDNDGMNETAEDSGAGTPGLLGNENVLPVNLNTVGDINVGAANGIDLLNVNINTGAVTVIGDGAGPNLDGQAGAGGALQTGTITFDSEVVTTVNLNVTGANNVTITSVDTSDAQITGITTSTVGFTGTLVAPGASPAFMLDNTEELIFDNNSAAVSTITLGNAGNAGVVGNELSLIDANDFGGTLNLGTLADIDGTNDGMANAFTFDSGSGLTTLTLAPQNGRTPTLAAGSTWEFDLTQAAEGSTLTIGAGVVLGAGTLEINGNPGVASTQLFIDSAVDLSNLANLIITHMELVIGAGDSLTLTAAQVDNLGVGTVIIGSGTLFIEGDASNLPFLGDNIRVVNVDMTAVTLTTGTMTPADDADGFVNLTLPTAGAEADGGNLAMGGDNVGYVVTGSTAFANAIAGSDLADTITGGNAGDSLTGGLGNDSLTGGAGNDTFSGAQDDDTVLGGNDTDTLQLATGYTPTADANLEGVERVVMSNGVTVAVDLSNQLGESFEVTLASAALINLTLSDGDDTIVNAEAADTINGGLGNDTLRSPFANTYTNINDANLVGVENIVLTTNSSVNLSSGVAQTEGFNITGSDAVPMGQTGNDTITGGAGNDTINAGSGDDSITSSNGSDTVNGGDGADTYTLSMSTTGADAVNLGAGIDTVAIIGTGMAQTRLTITSGDAGNGNALDGNNTASAQGPGQFFPYGGAEDGGLAVRLELEAAGLVNGEDIGGGVAKTDGVTYRFDDEGIVFVSADGIDVRNLANNVSRGVFNQAFLGTDTGDNFTGTGLSLYANTGAGNDTVVGTGGADFFVGGGGDDTLTGLAGNDTFLAGAGTDAITDLGTGDVIVALAGAVVNANLSVDGGTGNGNFVASALTTNAGTVNITAVDVAMGTNANTVNLALAGGPNGYTVNLGGGDDSATGSDFADTLNGGAGADTLIGGLGNDVLSAGADGVDGGNDLLVGGAGFDTFQVAALAGEFADAQIADLSTTLDVGNVVLGTDTLVVSEAVGSDVDVRAVVQDTAVFIASSATSNVSDDVGDVIIDLIGDADLNLSAATGTQGYTVDDGVLDNEIVGSDFNDVIELFNGGTDVVLGGGGGDTINIAAATVAANLLYFSEDDGSAAGDNTAGTFDQVSGFDLATDTVQFGGDLFANIDDNGTGVMAVISVATDLVIANVDEVVFLSTAASLTDAGFASVRTAVGNVSGFTAGQDFLLFANDTASTGLYAVTSVDGDNVVDANEIKLIAVYDAVLTAGNLNTSEFLF